MRDGFTGAFADAKNLLKTKVGAENLLLNLTKEQRYDLNVSRSPKVEHECERNDAHASYRDGARVPEPRRFPLGLTCSTATGGLNYYEQSLADLSPVADLPLEISVTASDKRQNSENSEPLLMDRALLRRRDWTPPIGETIILDTPESGATTLLDPFDGNLMDSFGYAGAAQPIDCQKRDEEGVPTKRQRLDFVELGAKIPNAFTVSQETARVTTKLRTGTKKRAKSPKKYTTITGIATSHYFGREDHAQPTPMMQYLTATQNRLNEDSDFPPPAESVRRKRAPRKSKPTKNARPKTILLSPESALKTFDKQDLLFGSASQLARDESPTFIRDTVHALNRSLDSTQISVPSSTQNTFPSTIGCTSPRASRGTSRFAKSRSLWSAAGRDEDNALLQVDRIDLFDTPDVRLAFVGKDVLVEPAGPSRRDSVSPDKACISLRGGQLRDTSLSKNGCLDVDERDSPVPQPAGTSGSESVRGQQTRALHTTARRGSSQEKPSRTSRVQVAVAEMPEEAGAAADSARKEDGRRKKRDPCTAPNKPSFSGFTTSELTRQLSAYGFKPVKKRENMIQLLDRCWEDKHRSVSAPLGKAATEEAQEVEVTVSSHGDFLSNVHGLASRPKPKVRKPMTRRKKSEGDVPAKVMKKASSSETTARPKSPRKRKNGECRSSKITKSAANKTPTKQRTPAKPLSEEYVVDVDEIEDLVAEEQSEAQGPAPKIMAASHAHHAGGLPSRDRDAAEPLTREEALQAPAPRSSNPQSPMTNMQDQITLAITKYQHRPNRSHQREPTWHERILMYDPIVLEELALWLNTEGFGGIGEDREVSALEVREWCESRAICCLWKGGWRRNAINDSKADGEDG